MSKLQYWEISCFENKKQVKLLNPTFIYCDEQKAKEFAYVMNYDMIIEGGSRHAWAPVAVSKNRVETMVKEANSCLIDGTNGYTVDDEIEHMKSRAEAYGQEYPEWKTTTMEEVLKNLPDNLLKGDKKHGK